MQRGSEMTIAGVSWNGLTGVPFPVAFGQVQNESQFLPGSFLRADDWVYPIESLFTGGSEFVPSPRNPDIYWMQERSTRLK